MTNSRRPRRASAPPPEAVLIRDRRETRIPKLSIRRAARLAGISAQSWANVESGRKVVGAGVELPWRGTPDMLARMAVVTGVTPGEFAELAQAARLPEDKDRLGAAAAILGRLSEARPSARARGTIDAAMEAISEATGLSSRQRERLRELIEEHIDRPQDQ